MRQSPAWGPASPSAAPASRARSAGRRAPSKAPLPFFFPVAAPQAMAGTTVVSVRHGSADRTVNPVNAEASTP